MKGQEVPGSEDNRVRRCFVMCALHRILLKGPNQGGCRTHTRDY
jgi:hypothetical protein